MNLFEHYLDINSLQTGIPQIPASIFVVIPCYNEPDIIASLGSLAACHPPKESVAVLVVVNSSADSPEFALKQNLLSIEEINEWQKQNNRDDFKVYVLHTPDLPPKYAGVGWARKIGMDQAIRQLYLNKKEDGIIVSFDADSTVMVNYLQEIERFFYENPSFNFFTIDFAHSLKEDMPTREREGILRYELHMRYFRNAMHWCGYPNAIYTIGSSFAVRASSYVKQGGMNRRKAGEDFYFLHKLVLLGRYGNINTTTVFPSPRQSDRVPFGTGAAMKKWFEGESDLFTTYSLDSFFALKPFLNNPSRLMSMDKKSFIRETEACSEALKNYISMTKTIDEIMELKINCSNNEIFNKRFFHRINALWILKYLNFSHEHYFKRGELFTESKRLLSRIGINFPENITPERVLDLYRISDKSKIAITNN